MCQSVNFPFTPPAPRSDLSTMYYLRNVLRRRHELAAGPRTFPRQEAVEASQTAAAGLS